jgi:hypothetical protein
MEGLFFTVEKKKIPLYNIFDNSQNTYTIDLVE